MITQTDFAALRRARSFLFVPGDRPERFEKASASGADVVILDLEDAVAPAEKPAARSHVIAHLGSARTPTAVRINEPGTPEGDADLAAMGTLEAPVAVVVAKATAASLSRLTDRLPPGSVLLPLIESAAGVLDAPGIAITPGVVRLMLGHLDLAAELGIDPDDSRTLAPARFAVVAASAAAGIAPPVDGVCTEVRDIEQVRHAALASLAAGFPAKLCIHPAQVEIVHEALLPSAAELERARRIVEATSDGGVAVVDGAMVDRPVRLRAEAVLARAGEGR